MKKNNSILLKALMMALVLVLTCVTVFAEAPDTEPAEATEAPVVETTPEPEEKSPESDWTEAPATEAPEDDPDEAPIEEPVEKDPTEEPVEEEPAEEPVTEDPAQEPVVEDPAEEPVEEEPVEEEPVEDEPVEEEPVEEDPEDEPVEEEPVEEAPVEEEPDPAEEPEIETKVASYSFYANGELIATKEYELTAVEGGYTCTVELPEAPAVDGFEFAGWYIDGSEFKGGEVILADGGNFVVTASYIEIEETAPEYKVSVFTSVDGEAFVFFGTEITVSCRLEGFEDTAYTLQWQYTPDDGATVFDVEGATSESFTYTLTEENAGYRYRVVVTTEE